MRYREKVFIYEFFNFFRLYFCFVNLLFSVFLAINFHTNTILVKAQVECFVFINLFVNEQNCMIMYNTCLCIIIFFAHAKLKNSPHIFDLRKFQFCLHTLSFYFHENNLIVRDVKLYVCVYLC